MKTTRHWTAPRRSQDAPDNLGELTPEDIWIAGWEAAVVEATRQLNETLRRESVRPAGGVLKSRGGA
jgi:hypothetical protein